MFIDSRTKYIDRVVRLYDRSLFAERNKDGILCVYRSGKRYVEIFKDENTTIYGLIKSPEFILALTDNWKTNGVPIDYGALFIQKKLREMDTWEDPNLLENMDKQNDLAKEIKKKDRLNETEAWVSDNKRAFQKAFSDINTSNLSKREIRKENDEKNFKIKGEI